MYVVIELFVSALEEKNKLQNKLIPETISKGTKILDILNCKLWSPSVFILYITFDCFGLLVDTEKDGFMI